MIDHMFERFVNGSLPASFDFLWQALDLRKGQAECVIREMLSGRSKRRQQYSTLTQMIIQLLTVILEDRGET